MQQSQWDTIQQAGTEQLRLEVPVLGAGRAMKALADKRQGQDGKLEADDGSDEAFLGQAKLRAQRTLRMFCLAKTMMLRNTMKHSGTNQAQGPRSLGTCTFE